MKMKDQSPRPVASMEESFKDIVSYVDKNYRTLANKKNRAVCGLSMGGGHSFAISKLYPDWFDYVGLFSAAVPLNAKGFDGVMENSQAVGADVEQQFDSKGYPYEYVETDGGHIWRIYLTQFAQRLF